ncbi:hypothetical protein ACFYOF_17980 [Streptomyces sp. NPDC007148]|uniref:hypothetical protein n=1 Tax=Streptomyces sp. NPDC007148 TaxID=3364775 RepID=UPI0036B66559
MTTTRVITDRYVVGTRLRLRRADFTDGRCELKLTQKVPVPQPGAVQGLITNTYLSPAEYDVLAPLPAAVLSKCRFSVPPLGVDVFDGHLQGLVLAEAEFTSNKEAQSFMLPAECVAKVTDDTRFTGGSLSEPPGRSCSDGWPNTGSIQKAPRIRPSSTKLIRTTRTLSEWPFSEPVDRCALLSSSPAVIHR